MPGHSLKSVPAARPAPQNDPPSGDPVRNGKRAKAAENPKTWSVKLPFLARLGSKDKIALFKYLAVMTDAGIPLEKALEAVHEQARSTVLHRVLHVMITDVTSGEFLSTAMRRMPGVFDGLQIGLVEAGENSGSLAASLFRISENIEKNRELKAKVQGALLYPFIVLLATGGITAYLMFFLLPQIAPLFASLKLDLPWTTRVVMAASQFFLADWGWALVLTIGAIALFALLMRLVRPFHYAMHAASLYVPVFGQLSRKVQVAQMSRVLGVLTKSGITVVDALHVTADSLSNDVYRGVLKEVAAAVQEGDSIAPHLAAHPSLFSPFIVQMINVGEETGKLDESFLFVSGFSEREVDDTTKTLTTILEPLLMLMIGTVVGFIAIAIITPIYDLTKGINP